MKQDADPHKYGLSICKVCNKYTGAKKLVESNTYVCLKCGEPKRVCFYINDE